IAPAFGEDDMNLGKKHNLPFIQHVGMNGVIKKEAKDFIGMNVKPSCAKASEGRPGDDHMKTDIEIIKYLAHKNLLFAKEKYEHSYPHCWRCETPLINYATSSWFVSIEKIKKRMLETAKDINWSPAHIKEGRFGNWLEGARDWSISRQRFWASVMPIWECRSDVGCRMSDVGCRMSDVGCRMSDVGCRMSDVGCRTSDMKCDNIKVIGSVKELEELSGEKITDLHKHTVDKITFKCEKCGGEMRRIPDVLDTWFDSGSMPYAQMHYPFANKKKFENNFPAEFIAEGVDQTRCWFYYLHAIASGITGKPAYKNVIVNGIVLAEDGKKMSKKLNNYPDPMFVFEKYGADALRYYLLTSPVMLAENLNFSEDGVRECLRKTSMLLWNVFKFYELFAPAPSPSPAGAGEGSLAENVLDKWIVARLNQLIAEVTENMDNYNLPKAARPIADFIDDLSTWYLRRSRDRFKGDLKCRATNEQSRLAATNGDHANDAAHANENNEHEQDKQAALQTTHFVLLQLVRVMAPFMPFIAEQIWQKVTGNNFGNKDRSVHLESWPKIKPKIRNLKFEIKILEEMVIVRKIVELGLAKRDEAGIKVRQPLRKFEIGNLKFEIGDEYIDLIKDELNVKIVETHCDASKESELKVELDTKLTSELKQEGVKRELVRFINNLRKDAGMTIQDRAVIYLECENNEIKTAIKKYKSDILNDTLADDIIEGLKNDVDIKREVNINEEKVILGIKKI
ncbi:class I tRNA ligase family protein, partial [Patescibacteria group bacterium]|nr:class I tRNA ligase family protein [Patescibacteria group bacterium]MBU4026339.1 class I tRNA ligase family protein [Patescibacteria group bacterium]